MAAIKGLLLQQKHTDIRGLLHVDPDKLVAGVTVALSLIIAFDDETSITVYPRGSSKKGQKILIPVGSMFIFSADLIHSGMACNQILNLRLHSLLALPEFYRGGETQGWIENDEYVLGCE